MQGGSGNSTLSSSGGPSITQFGGTGNDSLSTSGGSSIYMQGGTGNSTLSSSGGSSITQFGGTGNDSLYTSGGSSIYIQGGTGNSTLSSSGGSSITQFGGTGSDSLYSSGGSSVLMVGGTGNSTLSSSGGSSITQFGGSGNDSLYSSGGSSVLMVGGTGNTTLSSSGGSSITQFGGSGNDSLASSGGSSIYMQGGSGNSTLASSGGSSITQFGGTGNDSLYSSGGSSVLMVGGSGNTTLSSSGGSSITQFGGSGNDSLSTSGGSSIYMQGGTGNSTLSSSGGSSITQFGGSGNDSLYSSSGSSILMIGGSGTDSLTASGAVNALVQGGGTTDDFLASTGGSSVSLVGGSGNDTLSANGGTAIVLAGLDGDNTYELSGNVSATLNALSTFGQSLPSIDSLSQALNTILFPGMAGGVHLDLSNSSQGTAPTAAQIQNVAPGMNLALVGLFQNVVGGAGNNWIHGNASDNLLQGGGAGNDTLLGGSGSATLLAGSGNDSLVGGSGGTVYRFAGSSFGSDTVSPSSSTSNDTLDFSQFGGPVNLNLASSQQTGNMGGTGLNLTLSNPLGITGVIGTASTTTPYNDSIIGNSRGDSFTVGTGNDTFTGAGGDSFYFDGTNLGIDVLNEAAGTQNTLNFLGLGGGINLNLSQPVNADPVSPGNLTLTLSNPSAFTTVVGTPYADSITGNNSSDTIIGGGGEDSLVGGSGSNYIQGDITQVVYLNFAGSGQPGDLIYTASEAKAIQAALTNIYSGFNYVFTQDPQQAQQLAQMTGGQYIALNFGTGQAGGAASQLDVDHLHLNGSATIDITSFLGQSSGLVSPTLQNIINLSATIAAHELGHLSGLQHQDAFGPIGSGIYAGVNPDNYYPVYTGPSNATQTPNDVMASPDSVGTTLEDAAGQTYLGERDLINLAFNDTGTSYSQSNLSIVQAVKSNPTGNEVVLPDAGTVYQLGNLPALAVPNTLPAGVPGAGQTFAVTAAAVNATINTGQVQYYAFQGSAGELMAFQVISSTNTLNPHPILPALEVLDANGNLVPYPGNNTASAYYGAGAVNQHEFESNDSTLYDVTLPTTGTYYVGVTTLPISPPGNYQLFLYSFGTDPQATGDTLVGGSGSGSDVLMGSSGNDSFRFLPGYTGNATVYSGSGQDTVNLSTLAPANVPNVKIIQQFSIAGITTILPTLTTVTSQTASSPDVYGGSVTLTATVAAAAGTPTGSVTFLDNGQSLGSAPLSPPTLGGGGGGGSASLNLTTLPTGNDSITVDYTSNSPLFTNSVSQAVTQVVAQAQPTFSSLTASQSIAYGTPSITLSGHLKANAGQQTIMVPAGEPVTVTIDGISQSTKLDSSDNFTLNFNTNSVGAAATPWAIQYSYGGDSNFKAATDSSTTLTISTIPTTITVPSTTVTSAFGQPLTLTATVTSQAPNTVVPTGSVDFFDSTTQEDLGSVVLSANGTAQLVTDDLPTGTQTITLTYTNSQKNFLSSSTAVSVTIVPSVYVLDPTAGGALSLSGNASISVAGTVVVDSSSKTALTASGNASVKAGSIEVVGGVSKSGNATLSPAPKTGVAVETDPLTSLAVPVASTLGLSNQGTVTLSGNSTKTISPGIYSQITVSGNASLTMKPGDYILAGGGLTVSGNASISGSGVVIFNDGSAYNATTGSDGGTYGSITLSGNGAYALSAPTTGAYAGLLIFQDRSNSRALTLSGNSTLGTSGAIYAQKAALALSGNAPNGTSQQQVLSFVVDTMTLSGNSTANDLGAPPAGTVAYTPAQIRAAYGINNLSLDGTGQTVAVVDAYDDPDIYQALDTFDSQFGLTTTGPTLYQQYGPASSFLTVLNQQGQATGLPGTDPAGAGNANWEMEEALDVEWAHAIAPGAKIVLVEANSQALSDLMSGAATAASQPGVSVVSMSWGFTEGVDVLSSEEALYDSTFIAPGVTFVASTGDYGAADPEYPAFSPNVVAVGGTTLTLNADNSYNSETGWGYYSNSAGALIGSGGGISLYEAEPSFQQGVQSTGYRTTPDVSFVADPATGAWIADPYNLLASNPFGVVGGTSLSAPAWAGLLTLVNQGRVAAGEPTLNGSRPTEAQQDLYSLSQSDYNVITSGNNGYSAAPGYNLVTGLGTPVANLLVSDLIAGNFPATGQVAAAGGAQLVNSGASESGNANTLDAFNVFDALATAPTVGAPALSSGEDMTAASSTPLPAANDLRAKPMQAINSVLPPEGPIGAAVDPAFAVADMGWLRMWAWLMLGLGEDPNRASGQPDFAPDALGSGSYLPSQPVFNQSAAGLGSNRKGTPSAGNPSVLMSENGSNPRPALEDDEDSAEDSAESAIREEPADSVVADQFFRQSSGGERDGEGGDSSGAF
jgi:Ca2+-binding RTX toxin-like protein